MGFHVLCFFPLQICVFHFSMPGHLMVYLSNFSPGMQHAGIFQSTGWNAPPGNTDGFQEDVMDFCLK